MKAGFVALVGRPNAGKSTLLNRLVGQKLAIVSDKPQTTRNRIVGVRQYPDAQIVFVDTPGVHKPLHPLNVRMLDTTVDALGEVELNAVVGHGSEPGGAGDWYLMDLVRKAKAPRILVLNKVDVCEKPSLLPRLAAYDREVGFADVVPVSARTGENVDRLEKVLI